MEVTIALPPVIKLQNSAVRVLWLSYDHFSDYCPSFKIPNQKEGIELGILPDFFEILMNYDDNYY